MIRIELQGVEHVREALRLFEPEVEAAMAKALQQAGERIVAEADAFLKLQAGHYRHSLLKDRP